MSETAARRGPRSLFGELLDWMFAPLLIIWPIGVLVTWVAAQGLANRPYDHALADAVRTLGDTVVRHQDDEAALALASSVLALLQLEEDDWASLQVLGPRGQLLVGDRRIPMAEPAPVGVLRLRDEDINGDRVRVAALWVRADPSANLPAGAAGPDELLLVQVAETLRQRQRFAADIVKGVSLPLFVLMPVSALLAWFALTQGFRPMRVLQGRIRARAAEDLSPIEVDDVPEEVAPLVLAINEHLSRREALMRGQKRFLADAAHQMKTPLAGLRMQAELAGRALRAGQIDPRELQRSFDQIALSSQRAADMVSQLLALARTEAGGAVAVDEPVDVASMAREVTQDFVPAALARRIDLGFEGPEPSSLLVMGERWQLTELLRNLLDNALRYTPIGGEVTVRVVEDPYGKVVVLQVEDSGPGIDPSARERVFQPFYRQLGTGVDGSGLGLTIAGQIAARHRSRIELDDARPRRGPDSMPGARFTLRLEAVPVASADPLPAADAVPPAGPADGQQ